MTITYNITAEDYAKEFQRYNKVKKGYRYGVLFAKIFLSVTLLSFIVNMISGYPEAWTSAIPVVIPGLLLYHLTRFTNIKFLTKRVANQCQTLFGNYEMTILDDELKCSHDNTISNTKWIAYEKWEDEVDVFRIYTKATFPILIPKHHLEPKDQMSTALAAIKSNIDKAKT
jgi:hypothetical protein